MYKRQAFTSDHGEEFAEHGHLGHGSGLWEEQLRVPLLLRGPGLAPGRRRDPASLVDLAPTLLAALGLERGPTESRWAGRSLLEDPGERGVFAYQCDRLGGESPAAWIGEGRKLLVGHGEEALSARPAAAYDLERDAAERDDRAAAGEPWVEELWERLRPEAAATLRRRIEAADRAGAGHAADLMDLGYTDR